MVFPQTKLTLIQRLSAGGSETDWQDFLNDYWEPVCRFAMRRGNLAVQDAEDIAAETVQAILKGKLLARWSENRAAKLRTLICGVVRNIMSNRGRVANGRKRHLEQLAALPEADLPASLWSDDAAIESADVFYAVWATELLKQSIERLMLDLHREQKGDYFRVLHGRICEGLTTQQVAELLSIKPTDVENHLKAAKKRLAAVLESAVRRHAEKYSEPAALREEFDEEWKRLSEYLDEHGGLADSIRQCHEELAAIPSNGRKSAAYARVRAAIDTENQP